MEERLLPTAASCVGFAAVWHERSSPPGPARKDVANSAALTLLGFLAVFLVLVAPAVCAAAASVGMVTKIENQAQVGGAAAAVGTIVHMNDVLTTGPKARLQVTFRDQTTLTLGESARIVVDSYVFNPEASTGELLLSSSKGAFRMATGRLNQMRNRQIEVTTPATALAVRGTDWWWGPHPMKGKTGVLLISNSKVVVKKKKADECRCHGHTDKKSCGDDTQNMCVWNERKKPRCRCCEAELTRKHEGVYLTEDGCPGEVRTWTEAEVAAAEATVTFGLAAASPAVTVAAAVVGAALVVNQVTSQQRPPRPPKPKPMSP